MPYRRPPSGLPRRREKARPNGLLDYAPHWPSPRWADDHLANSVGFHHSGDVRLTRFADSTGNAPAHIRDPRLLHLAAPVRVGTVPAAGGGGLCAIRHGGAGARRRGRANAGAGRRRGALQTRRRALPHRGRLSALQLLRRGRHAGRAQRRPGACDLHRAQHRLRYQSASVGGSCCWRCVVARPMPSSRRMR